jgi:hypothetical protein
MMMVEWQCMCGCKIIAPDGSCPACKVMQRAQDRTEHAIKLRDVEQAFTQKGVGGSYRNALEAGIDSLLREADNTRHVAKIIRDTPPAEQYREGSHGACA